ncbi:MAG: hypothetical protein ACRD6X_06515 [Pyrinomonadaceae bacterium]
MKKITITSLVLFAVCSLTQIAVAQKQSLTFSRPTIITASCDEEPLWHEKIYEDDDYRFVIRDYGKAEHTPNFFVYGKKQRKWIEIIKLSTEHAELGHSPSATAKAASQASRDKSVLKSVNYVNLPLRIAGSTSLPEKITYDAENKTYSFNFNSLAKLEEMLMQIWVLKKDLDTAPF